MRYSDGDDGDGDDGDDGDTVMESNYNMHTVDVHGLLLNDTAATLYHSNHSNHSNHSMLLTVNLLLQTVRESSIHIHSQSCTSS